MVKAYPLFDVYNEGSFITLIVTEDIQTNFDHTTTTRKRRFQNVDNEVKKRVSKDINFTSNSITLHPNPVHENVKPLKCLEISKEKNFECNKDIKNVHENARSSRCLEKSKEIKNVHENVNEKIIPILNLSSSSIASHDTSQKPSFEVKISTNAARFASLIDKVHQII